MPSCGLLIVIQISGYRRLVDSLFTSQDCWVGIETKGEYTQGMTVVDRYLLTGNEPNAKVLFDIDREGFVDLIVDCLKAYD
ncbi:nucleoside hydrolase [Vibrio sp. HN007]|uniref:nucleoside hydrolase n=1 Tax=Vibrio iocasae TaxID=3098914 RepID=UPI0035D436DC